MQTNIKYEAALKMQQNKTGKGPIQVRDNKGQRLTDKSGTRQCSNAKSSHVK